MIHLHSTECCGVQEIGGLSQYTKKSRQALRKILISSTYQGHDRRGRLLKSRIAHRFGMFMFTQATWDENPIYQAAYGEQLKQAIKRLDLGTVNRTGPFLNPNTGNYIYTYNWVIDWPKALMFLQKELRKSS